MLHDQNAIAAWKTLFHYNGSVSCAMLGIYCEVQLLTSDTAISRKVVGKTCTEQYGKVIWDMINTLFLEPVVVNFFISGNFCFSFVFGYDNVW